MCCPVAITCHLLLAEFDGEVTDIVVGGGGGLAVLVDDGGADTFLAADEGEKPRLLALACYIFTYRNISVAIGARRWRCILKQRCIYDKIKH